MQLRYAFYSAVCCTALFACEANISAPVCVADEDCPENEFCQLTQSCGPALVNDGTVPVINEVYYNSPGADTGTFIEIRGVAGTNLNGHQLRAFSRNGDNYATISLNGSIPSSGYFVVAQDTTIAGASQINSAVNLFNSGGSIVLEQNGTTLDALAYDNPSVFFGEGQSAPGAGGNAEEGLSRIPNGADTDDNSTDFERLSITPGASNDGTEPPPPPPPTPQSLVLNEVYYNSPSTDTGTFIEIKGQAGTNLSGHQLRAFSRNGDNYATISLNGSIPSSGYFVVGQDSTVAGASQINSAVDLFNSGGSIVLEQNGTTLDALAYDNPSVFFGEGQSAPGAGGNAEEGLSRIPDGADTDNNSVDFSRQPITPGANNEDPGTPPPPPPPPPGDKKVLFDRTKSNDAGNADWRVDGAYSDWANELEALGFEVDTVFGSTVTAADLADVSVYIIPEPQNPFSDNERAVILNFVQQGGGVLLIGNHRNSDRNSSGFDAPEVFNGWDGNTPSNPASFLRTSLDTDTIFGLRFAFANSGVLTTNPITSHPVLAGVSNVGIFVGTDIQVLDGEGLLARNGRIHLAANTVGNGRVLAFGDSSTFSDGSFSTGASRPDNWNNSQDNDTLGINMVLWLSKEIN